MTIKKNGYIKMFRKSLFNDFLNPKNTPYDYFHAWFYLVAQAEYEKSKNSDILIGQFHTSVRNLSKIWGWSKSKVETFLKNAENDGMICVKTDTSGSVINIVKFSVYNVSKSDESDRDTLSDTKSDTSSDTKSDTSNGTTTGLQKKRRTPHRTPHRTPNLPQISHLPIKERIKEDKEEKPLAASPQNSFSVFNPDKVEWEE